MMIYGLNFWSPVKMFTGAKFSLATGRTQIYKAASKLSLQKHVLSAHEGLKYPCSQCNYKSTQQVHLQKHV